MAKLSIAMTLDREEYFPDEEAKLTISVTNTGSGAVEVFEPFDPATGRINIYGLDSTKPKADPKSWRLLNVDESAGVDMDAPSLWLQPMQPVSKTFVTSDPTHSYDVNAHGKLMITICRVCIMPEDEGEYEYRYNYFMGGRIEFKVVAPLLEQWTQVKFEKGVQHQDVNAAGQPIGKPMTFIRLIRFIVLGYQGSHIIAVSVNPKTGGPPRIDPSGKLTGTLSREFGPYRRLVTSSVPITALQATADSSENITVTYADQTGKTFRLRLNPNRELVQ